MKYNWENRRFCSLMLRPVAQLLLGEGWQAASSHTGSMYLGPDSG